MAESRGTQVLAVNIAAFLVALIAALLRCYTRVYLVRSFWLDDWMLVSAMASFGAYVAMSMTGIAYGTGQHVYDLEPYYFAKAKMFWLICVLFYAFTMVLIKVSIGVFLLRVTNHRIHRWIIHTTVGISAFSSAIFFFANIFQCNPVTYYWDKYTQTGSCINGGVITALAYLFSVISICTDFTFALLPAWIVLPLKIKPKVKAALIVLMALGCLASLAIVIRMPFVPALQAEDFLYKTADIAIWSSIEQCLSISAASLATLRPLVDRLFAGPGTRGRSVPSRCEGDELKATGSISVQKSFSRHTVVNTSPGGTRRGPAPPHLQPIQTGGLQLTPAVEGGYIARCYGNSSTSQDTLRVSEESMREGGLGVPESPASPGVKNGFPQGGR